MSSCDSREIPDQVGEDFVGSEMTFKKASENFRGFFLCFSLYLRV